MQTHRRNANKEGIDRKKNRESINTGKTNNKYINIADFWDCTV
jgi:hypothetical protein